MHCTFLCAALSICLRIVCWQVQRAWARSKMCKKGKKRVRNPSRHEDAAVRLQRAREARASMSMMIG